MIHAESIFMDSGAHGLYHRHVMDLKKVKKNENTTPLSLSINSAKTPVKLGSGDFSYYSLKKGSPFLDYCKGYASYVKAIQARTKDPEDVLWVTVDAIGRPDLTWEIHQWFRNECGLHLMPVIHYGTRFEWVEKYLEQPECTLIGLGGQRWQSYADYVKWADGIFLRLCPESNKRLPVVRVHGFAVTGQPLMCRYPWWSVDSATWVKLSAYGWLYFPPWSNKKGWLFDRPPMMRNFSTTPPKGGGMQKHISRAPVAIRELARKWLKEIGVALGRSKDGTVVEEGVTNHYAHRSVANLVYFKKLEQSRPPWPWPLCLDFEDWLPSKTNGLLADDLVRM